MSIITNDRGRKEREGCTPDLQTKKTLLPTSQPFSLSGLYVLRSLGQAVSPGVYWDEWTCPSTRRPALVWTLWLHRPCESQAFYHPGPQFTHRDLDQREAKRPDRRHTTRRTSRRCKKNLTKKKKKLVFSLFFFYKKKKRKEKYQFPSTGAK